MRIALISDIHGNLEALEKALESIDLLQIDQIFCLGDIVGYGADSQRCLQIVRERAAVIILGNHDAAVVGRADLAYFNDLARAAILYTQSLLTNEQKNYIRSLPLSYKDEHCHLVHGTPAKPERWDYIFSAYDASNQFSSVEGNICFVGHSHVPGDYREKAKNPDSVVKRIVNVGSIGQPRDRDPRLCFVIYNTDSGKIEFIREEYNVETAAGKIRRAGLPEFLADRLLWGW